jgi:hypothetical protein
MLQYGFIPPELLQAVEAAAAAAAAAEKRHEVSASGVSGVSIPLFGMDRHDFHALAEGGLPWGFRVDTDTRPEPFQGTAGFPTLCSDPTLHRSGGGSRGEKEGNMGRHDFQAYAEGELPWGFRLDNNALPEPFQGMAGGGQSYRRS